MSFSCPASTAKSWIAAAVAVALIVVAAGCSTAKNWIKRNCAPTVSQQEESWRPYREWTINDKSAEEFVAERVNLVLSDVEPASLSAKPQLEADGKYSISIKGKGGGNAVAITADGYFLTAAHVVEKKDKQVLYLHCPYDDQPVAHPQFEQIFLGKRPEFDVALLWIDDQVSTVCEWSDEPPKVGDPVLSGSGVLNKPAAGHVTEVEKIDSGNGYEHYRIEHDAPFRPGDSGGPLFTTDGKLVAINYAGLFSALTLKYRAGESIRPDPRFIAKLIQDHREKSRKVVLPLGGS